MYEQYWGVNSSPFEGLLDSRFFVRTPTHEAALLKLRYLVEDRKGAGLLLGGSGYGKTIVARQFARELEDAAGPVVHLVFPQLSPTELLAWLAVELGADENAVVRGDGALDQTLRQIVRQLMLHSQQGRHPVLIVDEAHHIDDLRVFQALRLLLNFQDQPGIEFSLVLVGETSLLSRLGRMPELDDRLAVKALLRPLSFEETALYVLTRLEAAGTTQRLFDGSALESLFDLSGGIPRKINRICDLALLVGYADQLTEFSSREIEAVSQELTAVLPD